MMTIPRPLAPRQLATPWPKSEQEGARKENPSDRLHQNPERHTDERQVQAPTLERNGFRTVALPIEEC